jgi:proline iminopeptidase
MPMPPETRELSVEVPDVTLYVRVAGNPESGNVLLALHGGPGMCSDYMHGLERLAGPDLAVVTYDQRGTGQSTSPPSDPASYSFSKYVQDLEAVRQAVGVERVHLFGHSWGGVLAMRYATAHPGQVRSIVLMGSGAPSLAAARAGQAHRAQRFVALQQQGILPEQLASVQDILPAYFSDPHFEMPSELENLGYTPRVEELTWSALGEYDFTAEVGSLEHPVLLLWGEDDPFGVQMAEATLAALSKAEVEFVLLEKCGHFWHECPDQFYPRVRAFLGLAGSQERE